MDQGSKDAVFYELSLKYNWLETKKEKMDFLDEVEQVVLPRLSIERRHRKSLIRKLRRAMILDTIDCPTRGRKPKYNDFDKHHLIQLWRLAGYPCGKRLKALIPDWLEYYNCSEKIKAQLKAISASQADIFLKQARIDYQRKISSGTIPAKSHIRKKIRLRDPAERQQAPGYIETDTVLHCGIYIWGFYAHTVSATDLFSGWTLGRVTHGKNAEKVVKALLRIEVLPPFGLNALFFDNGIEFVNHLLVQEFKDNREVDVVRGRVGKSNDQCHIEQKNNTFVRSVFGHVRIENPELVPMMNEIYEVWGNLHNFFMPQTKLISKDRIGSKVRKKYDEPKTPYQRIIDCPEVSQEIKDNLKKQKS